ncbi:MAG: TatD DNase family protein [Patescibacteria group bacterium]|nr:TatD DNase family protein [Patescibacteria group bacterium]
MLNLIDTHCHIHDDDYPDAELSVQLANKCGVTKFICVGTDLQSSIQAIEFAKKHKKGGAFASVGIHPHETITNKLRTSLSEDTWKQLTALVKEPEVVAIGEFGFDFFYHKEPEARVNQTKLAKKHLDLAQATGLPVILHIREAFEPFFELIADYPQVKGVVHSFSDTPEKLERILDLPNNFCIGLNGIMTFSKSSAQLQAARSVPLDRLVLETDSPYLTPPPERGTINSIKNTLHIAEFLSDLRGEDLEHFCQATTANAKRLFLI